MYIVSVQRKRKEKNSSWKRGTQWEA